MDKKAGIMAWAVIGAESRVKWCGTKSRKIDSILRDPNIAGHLSSNVIEELDRMAHSFDCEKERAQSFLDKRSNEQVITK